MNKLDDILRRYSVQGTDTKEKVLGAAFVVTDKDGKQATKFFSLRATNSSSHPHHPYSTPISLKKDRLIKP